MTNSIVSAGSYPLRHSKRENKLIETIYGNVSGLVSVTSAGVSSIPLTSAYILVGNASNKAAAVAMSSEASISNAGAVTLANAAVIGKVLTGYTKGSGVVAATDSILAAIQKLDANDDAKANLAGATFTGNVLIDNEKEVRFREATGGGTNYVGLKAAAALAGDVTFTLPAADGSAGQFLQTNGSAALSFATAAYAEKTATVTISEANLVAMNGAVGGDKELVAAQAGVVYVPYMVQIFADYDTAEYANGDDLVITLGTVAAGQVVMNIDKTAFIPGTNADAHCVVMAEAFLGSATSKGVIVTGAANAAININIKSGGTQFTDPGTAAGIFKVKVFYREIALLT